MIIYRLLQINLQFPLSLSLLSPKPFLLTSHYFFFYYCASEPLLRRSVNYWIFHFIFNRPKTHLFNYFTYKANDLIFQQVFDKKESKLVLSTACRFKREKKKKRAFNVCVSLFFSNLLYFNLFIFFIKLLNCHSVRLITYNQVSDLLFSSFSPNQGGDSKCRSMDGDKRQCGC